MLRIAIFLHQLDATGVALNAMALGRHMRSVGWDVVMVTVRPGGALSKNLDGLQHEVLGGWRLSRSKELALSVPALRCFLNALAPDVILSAGNHAHFALLVATTGALSRRTVYRFSNDLTHEDAKGRRGTCFRRIVAKLIAKRAARLVLVSEKLASDPILAPHVASGKAAVIPNGVDVALVRSKGEEAGGHVWLKQDVPIVLGVGRLVPQKNFGLLLEAFALAQRERDMRLMIVGEGKRDYREALEAQGVRLGIADVLCFTGAVDNPYPYFRAASVLVIPSLWEGSPNVLLEALASGTPVVASRTAGNAVGILDNGQYGVLTGASDIAAISSGILQQIDPDTRIEPGDRAKAFDRSQAFVAYQTVFEGLLQSAS